MWHVSRQRNTNSLWKKLFRHTFTRKNRLKILEFDGLFYSFITYGICNGNKNRRFWRPVYHRIKKIIISKFLSVCILCGFIVCILSINTITYEWICGCTLNLSLIFLGLKLKLKSWSWSGSRLWLVLPRDETRRFLASSCLALSNLWRNFQELRPQELATVAEPTWARIEGFKISNRMYFSR